MGDGPSPCRLVQFAHHLRPAHCDSSHERGRFASRQLWNCAGAARFHGVDSVKTGPPRRLWRKCHGLAVSHEIMHVESK